MMLEVDPSPQWFCEFNSSEEQFQLTLVQMEKTYVSLNMCYVDNCMFEREMKTGGVRAWQ